ncbi:hypothetical protein [Streptomyces sp. NPDC007264]|uniref:hypothetical protein n=1 Tax=Streptomyces sp. NPDC007264 TaxID=3364777 RepID=UPI0036DADE44
MTVAVLADSPTLTSGFGRTTGHIAGALARAGHDVACFGIKARPGDLRPGLPYSVWPAEQGGHWTDTLPEFFATVRPDVLLLNMDAYNALECVEVCARAGWDGPTVSYVCFDGLPVSRTYLEAQRSCAAVWATSRTGAAYLESEGIAVAGHAPPGVDPEEFRPDPDREALRARAGLAGASVVGVFATNTERKQVARAVAGFAAAVRLLPGRDLRLYLHCRPRGHWDLRELADRHDVGGRLIFPSADDFEEHRGVLTTGTGARSGARKTAGLPSLPPEFSYVDRINVCDVLVNVPHSGDVEQVIIEGQACGVPLLHTDDEAVMSDAVGPGGILLPAADVGTGRIGQRLHHVSAHVIGVALAEVLDDPVRGAALRTAGLANAASYPWSVLENAALAMVGPYASPRESPHRESRSA